MAELLIPAELTHPSRSWYTREEARINGHIMDREARKLADWLKSDACPDALDAQPIKLRLGRVWYIAAEYPHQLTRPTQFRPQGNPFFAGSEPIPASESHNGLGFESRIYVLGKPHVKDSQGRTPFISCKYVWRDVKDDSEWYMSPVMDVEFTCKLIDEGRSHVNPYFKQYHPFGSWFHMHRWRPTRGQFYLDNRKRISMQCVDLEPSPLDLPTKRKRR